MIMIYFVFAALKEMLPYIWAKFGEVTRVHNVHVTNDHDVGM